MPRDFAGKRVCQPLPVANYSQIPRFDVFRSHKALMNVHILAMKYEVGFCSGANIFSVLFFVECSDI